MSYLTEPEAVMTEVHVGVGEELQLCISDGQRQERRCPDLVKALLECTDFVNERFQARGQGTRFRVLLDGPKLPLKPDGLAPAQPTRAAL